MTTENKQPEALTGEKTVYKATDLFLLFERNGAMKSRDVVKFKTKPELDEWLYAHDVTPISIIRGREKLFKVKVTF